MLRRGRVWGGWRLRDLVSVGSDGNQRAIMNRQPAILLA